ncbi:MAG: gliding motility-associated C-terminal domain-containing protein [Saprospiraceae bacterium]|nr:gliding motility-associated C-terminal domain-containing protein [Saprospiraceae bacterium]
MKLKLQYLLLCTLGLFWTSINAQLPLCGNPAVMENDCSDACVLCELDGVSSESGQTVPGNAPPGYCTQVVHSIRYIAFVAGSTSLSFSVTVNSCSLGNSIELGVYESPDCSSFDLVSNCNTAMPRGGTFQFVTTKPLKIGCHYYIVIDGNGPAICNYTIRVTSGSAKAPIPTLGTIDGPKKFCVGESADYTLSNFTGACNFEWTAINGTIVSSSSNKATVEWNVKGVGKLCVEAKNACHSANKCIDVIIGDASPPEIVDAIICENGSYTFNGNTYGVGNYEIQWKNHFGCDSTIELNIEAVPENKSNKDTVLCFPNCITHNGNQYCKDGIFILTNKSKVKPFCDSLTELNLNILHVEPKIFQIGKISCSNPRVILSSDSSIIQGNGKISKRWFNAANTLIDSTNTIIVDSAGKYRLTIRIVHPSGKICESFAEYLVLGNAKAPDIEPLSPISVCENNYYYFNNLFIKDNNSTNSTYKFYSGFPFTSGNEINDSVLIFSDSTLYIVADNQGCADTTILYLKFSPKIKSQIIIPKYCVGDTIRSTDIQISYSSAIEYKTEYYSCPELYSLCKINFPFIATQDTHVYFKTFKRTCSELHSFSIPVSSIPRTDAILNKKIYCSNQEVLIQCNSLQFNEERILIINNKDTLLINSDTVNLGKLSSGKYTITIITRNQDCSSSKILNFEVVYPDILPILRCYSNDKSITFYWDKSKTLNKLIFDTDLPQKIGTITADSVVFSDLTPGTKIKFSLILLDSICGDQKVETECEAIQCPNVDIIITGRDSFCLDNNGNLILNFNATIEKNYPGYQGKWLGPGLTDSINGVYEFKNLQPGKITIAYEYYKGSCRTFIQKEIWLRKAPRALFLINDLVCQDSSVNLKFIGSDTLDDANEWELSNATINQNNNNKNFQLQWKQPGTKKIKLKLKNHLCEDQFEKEIEVTSNPLPPTIECISQDSSITFNWKKGNYIRSLDYEIINGQSIKINNDSSLTIDKLTPGQKVKIKLNSRGIQPCGDIITELECEAKVCPSINVLVQDTAVRCLQRNIQNELDLATLLSQVNLKLELQNANIRNNRFFQLEKAGTGIHCLPIKAHINDCKYYDTLCIHVGETPEAEFLVKDIYCPEDQEKGKISLLNYKYGAAPIQLFWNNSSWDGTELKQLNQGKFIIHLIDKFGCRNDTSFSIEQAPDIDLSLGPDIEIEKGKEIQLQSKIQGTINSILWTPAEYLDCIDCLNPIARPVKTTEYIATIIDPNGCIDQDTLIIHVRDNRIFVPNVFSPNGDGINDYFTIYGTSDVKDIHSLNIYDRWGELVFSKTNFPINQEKEGWDGTFRSQRLTTGVYLFNGSVNFLNESRQEIYGEITLVR